MYMSNRSRPFAFLLFVVTCLAMCAAGAARADVEVLTLKYRNAEQVLPILRPLLEPGGAVSGMQNQIVLRASRRSIAEISRVLARFARPPRALGISVPQAHPADALGPGKRRPAQPERSRICAVNTQKNIRLRLIIQAL